MRAAKSVAGPSSTPLRMSVSTQVITAARAPQDSAVPQDVAAPSELAGAEWRVDPPHALPGESDGGAASSEDDWQADGADSLASLWSQMRTQAHQLADAMRRRQQDLDRREANLHAQAEQLEQESRSARLWWQGQLEELGRREQELNRRAGETEGSTSDDRHIAAPL